MNTSEKKIDYINFDAVPELINSGALFCCYIINYNLSDMITDYPLDKIVEFIDKKSFGDIDYEDYLEYVKDHGRDHGINAFFAQDDTFLGFLVIETDDTIFILPLWTTEISDTIWDCFQAFGKMSSSKKCSQQKAKIPEFTFDDVLASKSTSSISNFFKFMPL